MVANPDLPVENLYFGFVYQMKGFKIRGSPKMSYFCTKFM